MIDCAVATQANGVAAALWLSMNAWILRTRSATLRNEPRWIARWRTILSESISNLKYPFAMGYAAS